MGRNFGLGSRDMARAGQMALQAAAQRGAISFSTAATQSERWNHFARWAKAAGIKKMERITRNRVLSYGQNLADQVQDGDLAASTAQNRLSAVNTVMTLANPLWQSVSPTQECRIPARSGITQHSKAIDPVEHERLLANLTDRLGALIALQRSLGLRFEESAKLDAISALAEAKRCGQVSIEYGTKGGRSRRVPASPAAIAALEQASKIQDGDRSMIPRSQSYAHFQDRAYRELQEADGSGFHGERHHYAQARYLEIVGAPSPVATGWGRRERFDRLAECLGIPLAIAKEIDQEARARIAQELGHNRIEITHAYLG